VETFQVPTSHLNLKVDEQRGSLNHPSLPSKKNWPALLCAITFGTNTSRQRQARFPIDLRPMPPACLRVECDWWRTSEGRAW
jgi:hypothetical protein